MGAKQTTDNREVGSCRVCQADFRVRGQGRMRMKKLFGGAPPPPPSGPNPPPPIPPPLPSHLKKIFFCTFGANVLCVPQGHL